MAKNDRKLTIMMPDEDYNMLRTLSKERRESMAQVLRHCTRALYSMDVLGQPRCANGLMCFIPHYHKGQQPLQPVIPPPFPPAPAQAAIAPPSTNQDAA